MRFVLAVQEREKGGDKQVEQVSRELWRRIWSEDKDITKPASLSEVPTYQARLHFKRLRSTIYLILSQFYCLFFLQAAKKAGLSDSEIKDLLELSTTKELKDKLKSTTQDALDYGVSCPAAVLVDSDKRDKILLCNKQNLSHCLFLRHSASRWWCVMLMESQRYFLDLTDLSSWPTALV